MKAFWRHTDASHDPLHGSPVADALPVMLGAILSAFAFLFVFAVRTAEPEFGTEAMRSGAVVTSVTALGVVAGMVSGFIAGAMSEREEVGFLVAVAVTVVVMALLLF